MLMACMFMCRIAGLVPSFVDFGFQDQGDGAEKLNRRDNGTGDKTRYQRRQDNRPKNSHAALMTGKRTGMAYIMCSIMDGVDVRKSNNAHNE
jgi:hypothetical protein